MWIDIASAIVENISQIKSFVNIPVLSSDEIFSVVSVLSCIVPELVTAMSDFYFISVRLFGTTFCRESFVPELV